MGCNLIGSLATLLPMQKKKNILSRSEGPGNGGYLSSIGTWCVLQTARSRMRRNSVKNGTVLATQPFQHLGCRLLGCTLYLGGEGEGSNRAYIGVNDVEEDEEDAVGPAR